MGVRPSEAILRTLRTFPAYDTDLQADRKSATLRERAPFLDIGGRMVIHIRA